MVHLNPCSDGISPLGARGTLPLRGKSPTRPFGTNQSPRGKAVRYLGVWRYLLPGSCGVEQQTYHL